MSWCCAVGVGLRERDARREAGLERVPAELAVSQRLVFGRSSEQARPGAAGGHGDGDGERAGGGRPRDRGRGRDAGITRICLGSG